ncbi:fatty acid desaturase [uncultured Microbulbifer sp.]|uniref:acyl-CoA desaturase n=1 Tax=uncultured Microbulbifer sp. TaxID=348147 RepID=UPI0025EB1218|nr:fatty acid desaturase [uncultured Microbulbifer sp.]
MNTAPQEAPRIWLTTILFASTGLAALVLVPLYGILVGYHWYQWLAFAVLGAFCGFSITAGYHRLWSHRTYEAHWSLRLFFALFGAAALQNSALIWCSGHRRHHRHCDDNDQDPYSANRGFWFSHIGWMLREYPSGAVDFDNAKDLQRDKIVMWQHNHYIPVTLAMNIGVPLVLGLLTGDVIGMLLLAGVLRIVVNHHTTFFINSLAHIWGRRPYTDENTARDNDLLAFFTFGEGYHNYHHIFQTDYRNGIRWYQWDPTKWLIKTASWLGLARNLKTVPAMRIQRAMLTMQFKRAEQKLENSKHKESWKQLLEREAQDFSASLTEWKALQQQRYENARERLVTKWENATIRTRVKELEYSLKMQRKRLQIMMGQFHLAPVAA